MWTGLHDIQKPDVFEYVKLREVEVKALDKEKSILFMSVSPIEVHGYHLPLGTDVFVSEKLQELYINELYKQHPDFTYIKLPPLYLGADALPFPGSISVPAKHLEGTLTAYGQGLAKQGFRYLFISDNHGGPRHQMAIEAAARRLWRLKRFYLIDPFGLDYRCMVQHEPRFMKHFKPGTCGDDADNHSGTNETSLMLACDKALIMDEYESLDRSEIPDKRGLSSLIALLSKAFRLLGGKNLSKDLEHLSNVLAWVNDPNMKPYMGDPCKASVEAGNTMLQIRVKQGINLFEQALESGGSKPVHIFPMLWALRILRWLPE